MSCEMPQRSAPRSRRPLLHIANMQDTHTHTQYRCHSHQAGEHLIGFGLCGRRLDHRRTHLDSRRRRTAVASAPSSSSSSLCYSSTVDLDTPSCRALCRPQDRVQGCAAVRTATRTCTSHQWTPMHLCMLLLWRRQHT